ncbi:MAG: class F sortase [Clostridia bacterium]|nr:class F sortase [Clostridia bacterium]
MSVICPVTNKECPYLKKLDTDICPREHTCDAVRESYSGMIQKPPAPRKFLIILFSVLLALIIGISIVYFFVLKGDLTAIGIGRKSADKTHPPSPTVTVAPTPTTTPEPTPTPSLSPTKTPLPVTTPLPSQLPPVPVTSEAATKPVRIEIGGQIAEVKEVPLDENQNISVLPTALAISWYEGSYMPGDNGNCILFGYKHFDGMAGLFYDLDKVKNGEIIKFTLDNGMVIEQTVTEINVYRDGFLPQEVLALENSTPRTVMISETGEIDPESGTFKDLIVVVSE